jgi:hypothetical protein
MSSGGGKANGNAAAYAPAGPRYQGSLI